MYMNSIYFRQTKNAVLLQALTFYVTISRITIQIIKKLKNYYIYNCLNSKMFILDGRGES